MSISVNRAIICGNVGSDPERKGSSGDGDGFVTMRVATSRSWKSRDGERQEKTEWHTVVLFDKVSADFAERYVKKGDKVYVEGMLETRKWEKDGRDVYFTEVVVRPFDGRIQAQSKDRQSGGRDNERGDFGRSSDRGNQGSSTTSRNFDDEIPF
jgi:single-strand DNA-binding protein